MSYTQNNPFSRKSSPCAKRDEKSLSEIRKQPGSSNAGKYPGVTEFCGPAGGAAKGTYPVNTKGRISAAKSYADNAPNPSGIIACADKAAKKEGMSRESSQLKKMPIEDDMHKKGEGDMGMSRQPWGGNKHDYKRRDVDGVMKKTGDVDGHYKDYEGPSRKSSSPLNDVRRKGGQHIAHSHKVTDKDGNPKVYKDMSSKNANEASDIAEQRYRPRDIRSGKKEKSISRKSSPLNNTGMTGLNYSKELRYNAIDDITQGKGEADYGFSRESSSPLNTGSWAYRDAERAEELYKKGDDSWAHALGIDEHDADYAKHWHKDEAEHGPSRRSRSERLRDRAMKRSERSGAEQGDYDYEDKRVQKMLSKASKLDERGGKEMKMMMTKHMKPLPEMKSTITKHIKPLPKKKA